MSDDWFTSLDDLDEIEEKRDREEKERIFNSRAKRGIPASERPERPNFSYMAPGEWLSGDDITDIQDYEDGQTLDHLAKKQQRRDQRKHRP